MPNTTLFLELGAGADVENNNTRQKCGWSWKGLSQQPQPCPFFFFNWRDVREKIVDDLGRCYLFIYLGGAQSGAHSHAPKIMT